MMTDSFKGFLCWEADRVTEIIKVDAASLPAATLLSVHYRTDASETGDVTLDAGTRFSDEDVRVALLDQSSKLKIIPIVGDAGAGKSHLIQWLNARISSEPNMVVVYLPRSGTGLRGLLALLIDGLERSGAESHAEALRQQLNRAFSGADLSDLPRELINQMAGYLEAVAETPPNPEGGNAREQRNRAGLAKMLPYLLYDPVSRDWFLQPGSAIHRFVSQQTDPDPELAEGVHFVETDFPAPQTLVNLSDLGGPARDAISALHGGGAQMLDAAVRIVNEALTAAIPRVFGLTGEHTLSSVLQEARKVLLQRGDELVLLIEDLTRLQGVDRELLNAIMDPVEVNGKQVMSTLRVAMAVTSGYYETLPEGFRSRADDPFDLNKRQIIVSPTASSIEKFASGYLRSIRTPRSSLEEQYQAATDAEISGGDWMKNPCDVCQNRTVCHEDFGHVDGIGLYPFNREALKTMAYSAFAEDGGNGKFNPRRLLIRVLLRVMSGEGVQELKAGKFPSKRLELKFIAADPLPGAVMLELAKYPDRDRREVLLRFWGGAPSTLTDLKPGIHEAFGLPLSAVVPVPPPVAPPPVAPPPVAPPPPGLVPVSSTESDVDDWAAGRRLPREAGADLRRSLYSATIQRVPWAQLGVQENHPYFVGTRVGGMSNVLREFSYHIDGETGQTVDVTQVTRAITREDKELLIRLSLARRTGSAFRADFETYCFLLDYVDATADDVTAEINKMLWSEDPTAASFALTSRLATAALMSGSVAAEDDKAIASGLFDLSATPAGSGVSASWQALSAKVMERREDMVVALVALASYRQGATTPGLLRTGRVAFLLRVFLANWSFPARIGEVPHLSSPGLADSLTFVSKRDIETATDDELKEVKERLRSVDDLVGLEAWDPALVTQRLNEVLVQVERVGCFQGDPFRTRQAIEAVGQLRLSEDVILPPKEAKLAEKISSCSRLVGSGRVNAFALLSQLDKEFTRASETANSEILALVASGDGAELAQLLGAVRAARTVLENKK